MTVRFRPTRKTVTFISPALARGNYIDSQERAADRHFQAGETHSALILKQPTGDPLVFIEVGNIRYSVPYGAVQLEEIAAHTNQPTDPELEDVASGFMFNLKRWLSIGWLPLALLVALGGLAYVLLKD